VKEGRRDIAAGAFFNTEREQYAYYSIPYRTEKDMLYVRKEDQRVFQFETVEELIRVLESGPYRLGVVDGFFYGTAMMRYIERIAAASTRVTTCHRSFLYTEGPPMPSRAPARSE
jgi:ABC-type amino acid transport substrate-binding protein